MTVEDAAKDRLLHFAKCSELRARWRNSKRRKHAKVCPPMPGVARFHDEYLCRHGLYVFSGGGAFGGGNWRWFPDLHGEWSPDHEGFFPREMAP